MSGPQSIIEFAKDHGFDPDNAKRPKWSGSYGDWEAHITLLVIEMWSELTPLARAVAFMTARAASERVDNAIQGSRK